MSDDSTDRVDDDPHVRGGPPSYVQAGADTPTHAERTRTLVAGRSSGTLSTISLAPAGYPFGSIVTFALHDDGAPLILMSSMAEHAANLDADARCSLLVSAAGDGAGRLAAARATLVGTMRTITDDVAQEAATERYLTAHPDAFWARFGDFAVRRLEVEAVRYVRGFGEMSWVEAAGYAAAEADPVAPDEQRVVAHMNDDHRDAMLRMVAHHLPDVRGQVTDVEMLSCDRYGVELKLVLAAGSSGDGNDVAFGRIGFRAPLAAADEARAAMVELVRAAG